MRELTDRQRDILNFIRSFSLRHGVPPTVRELGERFRITPRAAFDHLRALERKGMLQRRQAATRTSRALVVVDAGATKAGYRSVPVLGRIAAGAPLLAEENREGELAIAPSSLPARAEEMFALRVRGDSMIEAHICDGDIILVRRQDSAQSNDIVVAMVDGEATVKRFVRRGEQIELRPEHPTMAPIIVDSRTQDFRILGKFVGLLRGF
jgi:repressor LexA